MEENKSLDKSKFDYNGKIFKVGSQTVNIYREASFRHRKAFTDALKNGVYTKKKLEVLLQSGEVNVVQEHIDKKITLLTEYHKISKSIETEIEPDILENIADYLSRLRNEYINEDMALNSLFSNTAEQIAEDERINYLCFSLIKKEDNSPVWSSYEEYCNYTDYVFIERCKYEILKLEYNFSDEQEELRPENIALHKVDELRNKTTDSKEIQIQKDESKAKEEIPQKEKKSIKVTKPNKKMLKAK